jgi:hypothetical protein
VIPTPDLPTGVGSPDLPTSAFPPLPTLTDTALIADISSALSGIALPTSLPAVDALPTDLPLSYTSSLTGLITSPLPRPNPPAVTGVAGSSSPTSIVTHLASAIQILLLLIRLIQETINTGGVRVPGVAELGVGVGSNLLFLLLQVVSDLIDKAGSVGALAF